MFSASFWCAKCFVDTCSSSVSNASHACTWKYSRSFHVPLWPFLVLQVHAALLRQSEEELEEARRDAAGGSREVDAQRGEVHRLREELRKQEEKMRSATREKQSLSAFIRQLSQEVEELRGKHQATGSNQSTNPSLTCFIPPTAHLSVKRYLLQSTTYADSVYTVNIHVCSIQQNPSFLK